MHGHARFAGLLLLGMVGMACQNPTAVDEDTASRSRLRVNVSGFRQLTFNAARDITPTWSSDGRWIAFASRRNGNYDIWMVTPEGDSLTALTQEPYHEMNPSWHPETMELAYIAYANESRGNIRIMRPHGNDLRQITYQTNGIREVPTWSPRGRDIAFCSFSSGNWDIWVASLANPVPWRLTLDQSTDLAPSWSPQGRFIAFSSDRSGNPDIWLISTEDRSLRQLTFYAGLDDFPSFSPDGKHLVFVSSRAQNPNGVSDLWLYSFVDQQFHRLTGAEGDDLHPQWSPDGRHIVFASDRAGNYDIWTLEIDIR